jgi:hypothetical protein
MARVGMGAVYTRTHDGRPLRSSDPSERARLPFVGTYVPRWFWPRDRRAGSVMIDVRRDIYGTKRPVPLRRRSK